jgi:NAD(P)-dependent dehydrogenase (short-subunit alcohol dehydrogenase family)
LLRSVKPGQIGNLSLSPSGVTGVDNVKGALFTVQKALPHMNDGGSVIVTGSAAILKGTQDFTAYGASKAAARNMVRGWTVELKDRQIRSNLLSAGPVATPLTVAQPPQAIQKLVSSVPWAA